METAVGSRKHTRKKEGVGGENGETEAKVSQGEKGGRAQAREREREGWLCPTIMMVMTVIIIIRVRCHQHLSLENALREQAELVNFLPALTQQHQQ